MRDSLDTLLTEHSQTHTLPRKSSEAKSVGSARAFTCTFLCIRDCAKTQDKYHVRDVTATSTLPLPTISFYTQTPIGFDKTSGIERGDTCV